MRSVSVVFDKQKQKWMVRWWRDQHHPVRSYFSSQSAADEEAVRLRKGFKAGISPDSVQQFEALKVMALAADPGLDVQAVFTAGLAALAQRKAEDPRTAKTILELLPEFLASRVAAGCRERTVGGYRGNLRVWSKMLPGPIRDISKAHVQRVLNDKSLVRVSRLSYARVLAVFLKWAGIAPNPATDLEFPAEDEKEIEFFSREEVLFVLREARPMDRGQLALVFFAGIRPEASSKMLSEDICIGRSITIRAAVSKDRRKHVLEATSAGVPGLYPSLWRWLRAFPFSPQPWEQLRARLGARLRRAGLRWKQDGTRHSFATHYYAVHGLQPTAKLLGHSGLELVRRHYAGVVAAAEAKAYFELSPKHLGQAANQSNDIRRYKIEWPSDRAIRRRLAQRPLRTVAKELGVSDVALAKHCRARQIATPGRGYWTRIRWRA